MWSTFSLSLSKLMHWKFEFVITNPELTSTETESYTVLLIQHAVKTTQVSVPT